MRKFYFTSYSERSSSCNIECSIATVSHEHFDHNYTDGLRGNFETVRTPGEHGFGDVRIRGVESFHDPEGGSLRGRNNIYRPSSSIASAEMRPFSLPRKPP